jgi:hypothetical protein
MCSDEFGNVILDSNPGFQTFSFAGGFYQQGFPKLTLVSKGLAKMYSG